MSSLLLVDDHQLLRQSLRRAVEEAGFVVVAEAGDGAEAVRLAVHWRPDLVLMDVAMPVLDGIEATRQLRSAVPEARVVILSMHGEEDMVQRALQAGAVGYLVKDCTLDQVAGTLRAAAGDADLSSSLASSMLAEAAPVLSQREVEVLQRFADGLSTSEVARSLYISAKTVKNHLASVYEKLDAHDRTQAVLTAVRMGIVRLS